MRRLTECVCIAVLLLLLVQNREVESSQLLIPACEQSRLVLHGSEILQCRGIHVYFKKTLNQDMFPFLDALNHSQ